MASATLVGRISAIKSEAERLATHRDFGKSGMEAATSSQVLGTANE